MEEKKLYTLTDVAAALSVGRSKVHELVRSGGVALGADWQVVSGPWWGPRDLRQLPEAGAGQCTRWRVVGTMAQGGAAPKLRNGVMRRGSSWSYVIRVTDSGGVSKPRWVGSPPRLQPSAPGTRPRSPAGVGSSSTAAW